MKYLTSNKIQNRANFSPSREQDQAKALRNDWIFRTSSAEFWCVGGRKSSQMLAKVSVFSNMSQHFAKIGKFQPSLCILYLILTLNFKISPVLFHGTRLVFDFWNIKYMILKACEFSTLHKSCSQLLCQFGSDSENKILVEII